MEEKSFRSNKLTHLFETLLQQEEQERQQEQEQEEQELEQEEQEQVQRRMVADPGRRYPGNALIQPVGTGRRKIGDRESIRFAVRHVPPTARSDNESKRAKNAGQSDWSAEAVSCLLECYAEKYASGRAYLRNSDWEEVVCTVNAQEGLRDRKTVKQCRDKVDSLKKRYRMEKRKAGGSGSSVISWPLFSKLDDMMSYQTRVARIPGGVDAGVKLPFSDPTHPEFFHGGAEQLDSLVEFTDMPRKKRKVIDETDGLSDEEFDSSPRHGPDKHSGTQESLDEGSRSRKGLEQPGISGKACSSNPKPPLQALTDAVVGFSDVFARIEMAKMKIFTKMKLEMAKLERMSKEDSSSSSSSSSSSETE